MQNLQNYVKGFATIDNLALVNVEGTGMVGVPGTASAIFGAVKDVGANVIMISQVMLILPVLVPGLDQGVKDLGAMLSAHEPTAKANPVNPGVADIGAAATAESVSTVYAGPINPEVADFGGAATDHISELASIMVAGFKPGVDAALHNSAARPL
ncbi:uncharacterized protein LOC109815719 isoform X2 [Cajanus cajan]|nr:uncharacterized protein LOC109815719 isoform X2 [Cajanus cajan]